MFVPRALRLKGVKEPQRPKTSKPEKAKELEADTDNALVNAMQGISTSESLTQEDNVDSARGPRFTVKPITPEYIAQLAAGMELIFSDYAHQEPERADWLKQRYREVDGEGGFIHLTALLEHPNISTLKPEASQKLLQQALQNHPSSYLEVASNGYYVRRRPSSYPPPFLPHNSFDIVDDDGLNFWDQRTIYVEPHLRNMCQTPAKVAHWLKEHGDMRSKWLPVQAVHTLWNSCAFVVLSGSVMHQDVWAKWKVTQKPENWQVMTKVEHTKRTAEYVELLKKENPRGMNKRALNNSNLPPIARPAALPMDAEVVPDYKEPTEKLKAKRKRNRTKGDKTNQQVEDPSANMDASMTEAVEDEIPNKKRRG